MCHFSRMDENIWPGQASTGVNGQDGCLLLDECEELGIATGQVRFVKWHDLGSSARSCGMSRSPVSAYGSGPRGRRVESSRPGETAWRCRWRDHAVSILESC